MTGFLELASKWQTSAEKSGIVEELNVYTSQTKLFSDPAAENYVKSIRRQNSIQQYIDIAGSECDTVAITTAEDSTKSNTILGYWRVFGASCPNLQGFAIKCLQQICSASVNETNWSQFDYVVPKRRNKLNVSTQEKLVYCYTNYKLFNQ